MRISLKNTLPALCVMFLASCGGGGGGSSPPRPPPPPAPSALSYPLAASFTIGTAITQLVPTVTGTVASYVVAPALPAGLALNTASGIISGTPTAVAATANYVVTASNAGGSTAATLSLTVNDNLPDIGYAAATQVLTTGVPVTLTPTNTGGAATQWSVDQPLPAGLTLNAATGVISGNPTAISLSSPYVVTARNSGGTDTFNLNLAVQNGVLLDLGHIDNIHALRFADTRIASLDDERHMVLWNAQTGAKIMGTDTSCLDACGQGIELAGPTVVLRQAQSLDVRNSANGAPLATINLPATHQTWWTLAADGSYISAGSATGLTIWAPNGTVLFSRNGDHSMAKAFAASGELRLAGGPAGNVIEKISVPGGTVTQTPAFQGQAHSWFLDGERLLTNLNTTVWVYSSNAVQQDIAALSSIEKLTGQGDWFWTDNGTVRVFRVGASTTPAATYLAGGTLSRVIGSGGVLALLPFGARSYSVVDFSSGMPVKTDYTSPVAYNTAFAASSAGDWVLGNENGVILGELAGPNAPTQYSLGKAHSIAASGSRIAIATAVGDIIYFDAASRTRLGEIEFPSSKIEMSADETRLAAMANNTEGQYSSDRTVRVYELPSETVLAEWPGSYPGMHVYDMTLALSGDVIGQTTSVSSVNGLSRQVMHLDGTPIWSDTSSTASAIHLSPDGSRIAAPSRDYTSDGPRPDANTITNIYAGATLTTAVAGASVGWIDSNRLMVNRYRVGSGGSSSVYDRCEFVSPSGQVSTCPSLPELDRIQPLTSNSLYAPKTNTIYDLTSGASIWTSAAPTRMQGAVAGNAVVFASGATVRIEPR